LEFHRPERWVLHTIGYDQFALTGIRCPIERALVERPTRLVYLSSGMHHHANANLDGILWKKRLLLGPTLTFGQRYPFANDLALRIFPEHRRSPDPPQYEDIGSLDSAPPYNMPEVGARNASP
jgi:hypothetical protein